MSAAEFWETLHRHPDVCDQVLKTLVAGIRALNDRTNEHANFGVRRRLCSTSCGFRADRRRRLVVSPPPTHAELAARIGTHREAVTRFLNALERDGTIARTRGAIVLSDPERFAASSPKRDDGPAGVEGAARDRRRSFAGSNR